MKIHPLAIAATTLTGLLALGLLALAQTQGDHDFKGGSLTHKIDIPPGCTKIEYEVLDWDPISNDVLLAKKTVVPQGDFHILNMKWICIDGEVWGPDGRSGESNCSAFVRVTFYTGDTKTVKDSGYYVLSCE